MINKNFENGVIKSLPKKWSKEEVKILMQLKKNKKSFKEIAEQLERTEESCKRKYLRKRKEQDKYNVGHRSLKYEYNFKFLKEVNSENILDVFSGGISWYKKNTNLNVIDNDIKVDGADFKLDAFDFLYKHRKQKFDIVDLDPFGSAFDCFDFALDIAQKGLIITFGEMCSKRFNRKDFVESRYNIKTLQDFTSDKLSNYIEKRALIFKKKLTPIIKAEMTNILRIYYKVEHLDFGKSGCQYFSKKETQTKLF